MSDEPHSRPAQLLSVALAPSGASCTVDGTGHCVTCSDEALPARVLQVDPVAALALVVIDDATAEVDISLVDDVQAGQWLLVHGGVAIAGLEEEQ